MILAMRGSRRQNGPQAERSRRSSCARKEARPVFSTVRISGLARGHRPGEAPPHKHRGMVRDPMRQSPAVIEHSSAGRVEKATNTTTTTEQLVRFFMEFRRPEAVGDRPQKSMVCPTPSITSVLALKNLSLNCRNSSHRLKPVLPGRRGLNANH